MAIETPNIDLGQFVKKPQSAGIDLNQFVRKPAQASPKKESAPMQILPTREDIPGIASSALHGLTGGLTDVGRMTDSYALGGYGNQAMKAGSNIVRRLTGNKEDADPTLHESAGIPVLPQPRSLVGKGIGLGVEMLSSGGAQRMLAKQLPKLEQTGVRIAQNVLRPTGKLAKRSEQIARTALDEGVMRGSASSVQKAAQGKIDTLLDEVDSIAESVKDRTVTAEDASRRMDALARWYKQRGDVASSQKIAELKKNIISGEGLTVPVYGQKETAQFVMGPAGKIVKPQLTKIKGSGVSDDIAESVFDESKGEYAREIVSPKKFVEKPEDIVGLHSPGVGANPRKLTTISPKEEYQIRGSVMGPSQKETIKVGDKFKDLSIERALKLRRDQDALLKTKKVGGGYTSDTNSTEITGRKEFTGAIRRSLGKAVPEIAEKNRTVSNLIDVATSAGNRAAVENRNNPVSLTDAMILIDVLKNPKSAALMLGKGAWNMGKSGIARGAYKTGKAAKNLRGTEGAVALATGARRLLNYDN